ncbi:hypothetical protein V6Z12_D11G061700 [Gossypium hirsutum]
MYCPITGLIHSGCITDERPISIPFKKFRLAPLNSLDCDLACFTLPIQEPSPASPSQDQEAPDFSSCFIHRPLPVSLSEHCFSSRFLFPISCTFSEHCFGHQNRLVFFKCSE